jgi:hypothetical protein
MNLFKKIFVPTEEKQELIAYESWTVRWNARQGNYSSDLTPVAEVFTNKEDARTFANALKEAFKLIRNTSNDCQIEIKKN